jgi:hypothetical protein
MTPQITPEKPLDPTNYPKIAKTALPEQLPGLSTMMDTRLKLEKSKSADSSAATIHNKPLAHDLALRIEPKVDEVVRWPKDAPENSKPALRRKAAEIVFERDVRLAMNSLKPGSTT